MLNHHLAPLKGTIHYPNNLFILLNETVHLNLIRKSFTAIPSPPVGREIKDLLRLGQNNIFIWLGTSFGILIKTLGQHSTVVKIHN